MTTPLPRSGLATGRDTAKNCEKLGEALSARLNERVEALSGTRGCPRPALPG